MTSSSSWCTRFCVQVSGNCCKTVMYGPSTTMASSNCCYSKTKNARGSIDSTTTEVAADLYHRKILPRHDGPNDYLFFNEIKDRTYVGDRVSKMFKVLVQKAGLERDAYGQAHTTYSLRHSSLCFQILKTGGNDLFGLAKNARTSVLMLEKFYLTHLSPQIPEVTR